LLVKRVFFLLNAAFAMAILALISRVHLASFVIMLPKQCSTIQKQTYADATSVVVFSI
jgi:hypothetical protein